MSAPTVHPDDRRHVQDASEYQAGDRVWVWEWGPYKWRRGLVHGSNPWAVVVSLNTAGQQATGVNTVTARLVMPREESP